jgi:DNA mismatch repair protein MutS2
MARRPSKKPPALSKEEQELFLAAVDRLPEHAPPVSFVEAVAALPVRKKRSRESDPKLDLHGLTREQAVFKLRAFIDRCISLNKRRVLIVHGKGSGALRQEVRRFLAESGKVVSIVEAPARLGGDGAVLVELGHE